MRSSIARVLIVITLFMWVIVFPLSALSLFGQVPSLYQRWLRDGDVYSKTGQAITISMMRRIPQDAWSPWINRHPLVIHNVFELLISQDSFEASIAGTMQCWVKWWSGVEQQPCLLTKAWEDSLEPPQWERVRAYLWETLPSCSEAAPPACLPLESADYAANGQKQSAWWEVYQPELVQSIKQAETEFVTVLPEPLPRAVIFKWILCTTLCLTVAAFLLIEPRRRAHSMSGLFCALGCSALGVGTALVLGLLRCPSLFSGLNNPALDVIDIVMPQIWPALSHLLGITFLFTGCITFIPGLCGLALLTTRRFLRLILPFTAVAMLTCALYLYPDSAFARTPALPATAPPSTPTPWPTFTLTPTHTPSPTPTALPILAGTPLPLPDAPWWQAPEIVRCVSSEAASLEAIKFTTDTLSIIRNGMYLRFTFAESDLISEVHVPRIYDHIVLSPSGDHAGLSEGRDVWLYALPDWTPVFRSRISTLSPVTSLAFAPDASLIMMGLQNGYLWVTDMQGGELAALLPAVQSAVTALAPLDVPGYLFTGAESGEVQLWNIRSRSLIQNFSGHTEEIRAMIAIPSADLLITLDAANRFIMWQASAGQVLRERGIAADVTSNLLWVDGQDTAVSGDGGEDPGMIVGGTRDGDVFQLNWRLAYQSLIKLDSPITALEAVGEDYLVVGTADGHYCVVGSP